MRAVADKFREGKVAYEDLVKRLYMLYKMLPVKARSELFGESTKKGVVTTSSRSLREFIISFSAVLQYSLFDIASEKKDISYVEMLFIADIGEVKEVVLDNGEKIEKIDFRLDHNSAKSLKIEEKTYFLMPDALLDDPTRIDIFRANLYNHYLGYWTKIMKAFAVLNIVNKDNVMEADVLPLVGEVLQAFLTVDNRLDNDDMAAVGTKIKEVFINHIPEYCKKVKSLVK